MRALPDAHAAISAAQVGRLEDQVGAHQAEVEALQTQAGSSAQDLAQVEQAVLELQGRLNKQEQAAQRSAADRQGLEERLAVAETLAQGGQQQVQELQAQLHAALSRAEAAEEQAAGLQQGASASALDVQQQLTELREGLATARAHSEKLEAQLSAAAQELGAARQELDAAQPALDAAHQELAATKQELNTAQQESHAARQKLAEARQQLLEASQAGEASGAELRELQSQLQQAAESATAAEQRAQEVQGNLAAAQDKRSSLQQQLWEQAGRLEASAAEQQEAAEAVAGLKTELRAANSRAEAAEREAASLRQQVEAAHTASAEQVEQLQARLHEATAGLNTPEEAAQGGADKDNAGAFAERLTSKGSVTGQQTAGVDSNLQEQLCSADARAGHAERQVADLQADLAAAARSEAPRQQQRQQQADLAAAAAADLEAELGGSAADMAVASTGPVTASILEASPSQLADMLDAPAPSSPKVGLGSEECGMHIMATPILCSAATVVQSWHGQYKLLLCRQCSSERLLAHCTPGPTSYSLRCTVHVVICWHKKFSCIKCLPCVQSTASLPASAGVSPGMSSTAAEQGELPYEAAAVLAAQRAKHEADMLEAKKKFMQGEALYSVVLQSAQMQIMWPFITPLSSCSA